MILKLYFFKIRKPEHLVSGLSNIAMKQTASD